MPTVSHGSGGGEAANDAASAAAAAGSGSFAFAFAVFLRAREEDGGPRSRGSDRGEARVASWSWGVSREGARTARGRSRTARSASSDARSASRMTRMSSSLESTSSSSSSSTGFGFGLAFGLRRARRGIARGAVEAARWSAPRAGRTPRGMDLEEVALALALAREETNHAHDANHARHASANAARRRRVVQRGSLETNATFVATRRSRRRSTAGGARASRSARSFISWSVSGI